MEIPKKRKPIDNLTGRQFERLTVIEFVGQSNRGDAIWKCICICGNETITKAHYLKCGDTKSCGCLSREKSRETILSASTTHGLSKDSNGNEPRLYRIWLNMRNRCYNKNDKGYRRYGARGIRVCDEWQNDYKSFHNWAMVHGYEENLSIDRYPDNNGNYEPNNCRWATDEQQANNTIANRLITFNNQTQTLTRWAKEKSMSVDLLWHRLNELNWSIDKALTTPTKKITRHAKVS